MTSPFRSAWLPRGWTWLVMLLSALAASYAWSAGFARPAARFALWEARLALQQLIGAPALPGMPAPLYVLPRGCGPVGRHYYCNPVDNQGCRPGAACDDDGNGGFRCYAAANLIPPGAACDDNAGPSCVAGFACDSGPGQGSAGVCRKVCCDDTGCAGHGRCVRSDPDFGSLGVCH